MPLFEICVVMVALMLGGVMKGATGLGVPLLAVPVMAAYFDLRFAIAVILLPNLVSNAWQVWRFREMRPPHYLFYCIFVGVTIGVLIGVYLLVALPLNLLSLGVAGAVVIFVIFRLAKPEWRLSEKAAKILGVPAMTLVGIMQGATGVSAPALLMYMSSLRLAKDSFVFSVSLAFLVAAVVQVPSMMAAGLYSFEIFIISGLAILPVLAGIPIGGYILRLMSAKWFDRVILVALIILAIKLVHSAL